MRITVDLDDELVREAEQLAAKRRTTLSALIEDALQILVSQAAEPESQQRRPSS